MNSNGYILSIIIMLLFLILILDYRKCGIPSEGNKEDTKIIGKGRNKTVWLHRINAINQYLKSLSFVSVLKEIVITFLAAFLAMRLTIYTETMLQEKQTVHNLEYICKDVCSQALIQKAIIEKYDLNQITSEDLRLNSQIDLSLISDYLYSSSTIENIPKAIYAVMLNNCRNAGRISDYLKSGIVLSDEYLRECCEDMADCTIRISEEGEKWLQYKNKQISEDDLLIWLENHLQEIRAKSGDVYFASYD